MTEDHYAHVVDGLVVNVSVWDGVQPYDPGDGVTMVPLPWTDEDGERRYHGGIGWTYRDGQFVDERPVEDPFGATPDPISEQGDD